MICSLVKNQLNAHDFPSVPKWVYEPKANPDRSCSYTASPGDHPNDLNPTAIVYLSTGEHSIVSAPTAIITGGNFGGCSGLTAGRVIANWIASNTREGHLWFPPAATYNMGCFDYRTFETVTVKQHDGWRFPGSPASLEQCLNRLNIRTDQDVRSYLFGYLKLWLMPQMTDRFRYADNFENDKLNLFPVTEYSFIFYSGSRKVGQYGHGPNRYHLHLGQPPLDNSRKFRF